MRTGTDLPNPATAFSMATSATVVSCWAASLRR
jgi:hypothetical protein